jgi:hypothetical protein
MGMSALPLEVDIRRLRIVSAKCQKGHCGRRPAARKACTTELRQARPAARRGRPQICEIAVKLRQWPVGSVIFFMTSSRLKLAAFWRGGYSFNVARNLPT